MIRHISCVSRLFCRCFGKAYFCVWKVSAQKFVLYGRKGKIFCLKCPIFIILAGLFFQTVMQVRLRMLANSMHKIDFHSFFHCCSNLSPAFIRVGFTIRIAVPA